MGDTFSLHHTKEIVIPEVVIGNPVLVLKPELQQMHSEHPVTVEPTLSLKIIPLKGLSALSD